MNKKSLVIGLIIIALLLIVCRFDFMFSSNNSDNRNPIKQEDMIKCTLEWGRLAAIPESKRDFTIKTEGSSLTRAFRSSFYLQKVDLDKWIMESPGLQDAEITSLGEDKKRYSIKPGGNAGFAEVTIDFKSNHIKTYVYWS